MRSFPSLSFAQLALLMRFPAKSKGGSSRSGKQVPAATPPARAPQRAATATRPGHAAASLPKPPAPAPAAARAITGRPASAAEAEGSRRERARCAEIVMSAAGQRNPAMARELAFGTTLPVKEALAVLELAPAAASQGSHHPDRAARNPSIGTGGDLEVPRSHTIARGWDQAFAKANRAAA